MERARLAKTDQMEGARTGAKMVGEAAFARYENGRGKRCSQNRRRLELPSYSTRQQQPLATVDIVREADQYLGEVSAGL